MPLSNYLPSSRISQPGVCTSSTRPVSPYQGQVIYETNTAKTLVWNGSSWVFLSTSSAGDVGLVKIVPTGSTNSTLSSDGTVIVGNSVAEVVVTGVFSSTYDVYEIVLNNIDFSGTNDVRFNYDDAATNYNWSFMQMSYGSTTVTGYRNQTQANSVIGIGGTSNDTNLRLTVYGPNLAVRTTYSVHQNTDSYTTVGGGNQDATTQHTKFKISTSGTSMTGGTISVYGYRK